MMKSNEINWIFLDWDGPINRVWTRYIGPYGLFRFIAFLWR